MHMENNLGAKAAPKPKERLPHPGLWGIFDRWAFDSRADLAFATYLEKRVYE